MKTKQGMKPKDLNELYRMWAKYGSEVLINQLISLEVTLAVDIELNTKAEGK